MNHICYSYNWTLHYKKNLSTRPCELIESFNFNHLQIPLAIRHTFWHTSHRHKEPEISLFQTYCLWLLRKLYSFEKDNFFSTLSCKLVLSFWKAAISYPFTHLSVSAANIVFEYTEAFLQIFQYIHDPFSLD